MRKSARPTRRRRGTSLVETTVAATILTTVFAVAFPVMGSISDAGTEGGARVHAQGDNRQALLKISRDVMNASLTARDDFGGVRLEVLGGSARQTLTGHLGVTSATHGGVGSQLSGGVGNAANYYANATANAHGSGSRGQTIAGRDRDTTTSFTVLDAGAQRPRELRFTTNTRLRFQKVLNYSWGADGEPVIQWGPWVEYTVQGRQLVRIENGLTQVVSPNCSGFDVVQTTANTLKITLVTEHRTRDGKTVATQANHMEVVPKN